MLLERIKDKIASAGPMTVRDFLEIASSEYYGRGPDIGAGGDFYTAANVSLFPRALRRFAEGVRERLPDARVVEIGGGTGQVAAAIRMDVTVVEPSVGLAEKQRKRGLTVVSSLADLAPAPTVFFANEVLDALPVHRVVATPDGMRELWIEARGDALVEAPGPFSSKAVEDAARELSPLLEEGCRAEVSVDARRLLAQMARAAPKCVALFIDYGGMPQELFGEHNPDGTLRAFHEHRVASPLERPGEQDVTADVDFSALQRDAKLLGYESAGYRVQGEFLADLGLVDDMMQAMNEGQTSTYLAAKNLLLPGGMGERFKAQALSRGVSSDPPLPGFRRGIPAAVDR